MKKRVTAIFDIGKTNKKFFLFSTAFREVHREYTHIPETVDEDGYPTEDLQALQVWLNTVFEKILSLTEYDIRAINFSSYGASLVHLDEEGKILTPLYNYTKPYDEALLQEFYAKYGPVSAFCQATGSSDAGMLNSGMQLYWLKYRRPDVFKKIRYSLHLPQYLSYVFTGIPLSDYTSLGSHTALWDYTASDYHPWVYREGIHRILPPIVSAETSIHMNYGDRRMKIGVGIHDSSAALLPYIRSLRKPFLLLSTGTWNVALNPFSEGSLSAGDIEADCINYMRINGKPVKASRLFLGNEYRQQVRELSDRFGVPEDHYKTIRFNPELYAGIRDAFKPMFRWYGLPNIKAPEKACLEHDSFEAAYHQLMFELVAMQANSILRAKGGSPIERLYIDGGFTGNRVFLEMLAQELKPMKIRITNASLGSALGAAITISDEKLHPGFLKENYEVRKHKPLILK